MSRAINGLSESILVTGGAGFIGSAVVRYLIANTELHVINVDKLTYSGDLRALASARQHPRHEFHRLDINCRDELGELLARHRPRAVMNLAAESHVDRSIDGPGEFITTNVNGTFNVLEAARGMWQQLPEHDRARFRFIHVSTDEVYGELKNDDPPFTETTAFAPSSPYSASKAASDHLAMAWQRTYGLPVMVTNCSNNYGPYQFPEKFIPRMIASALAGSPIPVYGRGENIRDWLYVEDHVQALMRVLEAGQPGRRYNIGGRSEHRNIDVARLVCEVLDELSPRENGSYRELIRFVEDRPGHDLRYAIDNRRIHAELGWEPEHRFTEGLRETVRWYLEHPEWLYRD